MGRANDPSSVTKDLFNGLVKGKTTPARETPNKYPTGTRVQVMPGWNRSQLVYELGTVTEWGSPVCDEAPKRPGSPQILQIIMDTPRSHLGERRRENGCRRIAWVKAKYVVPLAHTVSLEDKDHYDGIPPDIGVIVRERTKVNGFIVGAGLVGRIIKSHLGEDGRSILAYFPQADEQGFTGGTQEERVGTKIYRWCMWINNDKVDIGCWNPDTYKVLDIFPDGSGRTLLKKGSFVQYCSERTHKFAGESPDGHTLINWALREGSLLEVVTDEGRDSKVQCRVVAGPSPDALGALMVLSRKSLLPLEGKLMLSGITVEIIAEISFKSHPLRGRKAKVILTQDAESEVGIEFEEDIGAGSLDGAGQEGRCLYVSVGALKESE